MNLRIAWISAAGLLVLACGRGGHPNHQEVATDAQPREEEGATASRPSVTDKALVQVVVYGLTAFSFQRDASGKLIGLSAHLPSIANPAHDIILQRGIKTMEWETVTEDDNQDMLEVVGKDIEIEMFGDLDESRGTAIGTYPTNASNAEDIGWMLQASEIDSSSVSFDQSKASTHITFTHGTIETCALAFPPRTIGDPELEVCSLRVDNTKQITRSASEIMIVRGWVPKTQASAKVILRYGSDVQTVTIEPTGGDPVNWKGTHFDTVIDIAIANRSRSNVRTMESSHADHAAFKSLFPGATLPWIIDSPDCPIGSGTCNCKPNIQPVCWTTYIGKLFANTPSGWDRPICPLIGWTN